jgi:GNAT superfamily N-acetyltransferase
VTIRPARSDDRDAIAVVNAFAWRETYRGLVPDSYLDRMGAPVWSARSAQTAAGDPASRTFVAVEDETIVGFVSTGSARAAPGEAGAWGEIESIYLLEPYKGRGYGRALMAAASAHLAAVGRLPFIVWVLTANFRAAGFYRHLGGQSCASRIERFAGTDLPETAFRFDRPIVPNRLRLVRPRGAK